MTDEELRKGQLVMLEILKDVDFVCRKNDIKYSLDSGTLLGAVRHGGFIPWDDDIDIIMMRDDYNKLIECFSMELGEKYTIETNVIKKNYIVSWTKILSKENFIFDDRDMDYNRGIFIDIFPYDYYSSNKFKREWIESILKDVNHKSTNFINRKIKGGIYRFKYFLINNYTNIYNQIVNFLIHSTNKQTELIGIGKEVIPFSCYININDLYPLKELSFEGEKFYVPNNFKKVLIELYGESYMELPPIEKRKVHSKGFIFK